mgnify:CR=1 FL=1
MRVQNIERQIRELAHLLAYEEESGHRFKDWYDRQRHHTLLLKKLYRIENKT